MHPLPLEGRACVASYDGRLDELVIYVAHQLPVPLQIGLSQVLGMSQRRLRVIAIGDTEMDWGFALSASPRGTKFAVTFGDRILIYGLPSSPPFTPSR